MTSDARQPRPLDEAWAALRSGRWSEARELFDSAVAQRPSPEAFEGLSWAAWWLDDADAVFAARKQAFEGYRDVGDAASAARLATWLGADQLDFNGALATASGWLDRAQRLLEPIDVGAEHGWLSFHQGYIASVRGQAREAEEHGAAAARVGREARVPDLEMLGLALQGMSLVSRGEVAEGMRCLDEASAIALADEATIPISTAWTCCFMVTACTRVLDFERAFEWCTRIAEFAARYQSRFMLGFCRSEYATIYLWRGQWDEAERALEESLEMFSASRPAMVGGPLVGLAELRRCQGRTDETRRLLELAGPSEAAQLCRGRLALDEGDAALALELGERVDRNISADRRVARVPVLELIARAQLANGALEEAAAAVESLAAVAHAIGTAGVAARVQVVRGLLAAAGGEPERARLLLEDAVDHFERCGARFDAACARLELAATLRAMNRLDDASREAELAHDELQELGAAVAAARARQVLGEPGRATAASAKGKLSRRETEVLALLTEGISNRAIGQRLCISEHTVHRHVTSILRKLDAPSRTAAAALALRTGLLDLE